MIDAYCGTGTIGIIASGNARDVIGVELNRDAIRDARMNARENKIRNVRFVPGDAGWFMEGMAAEGEKVEVVLMDPPRSGSDRKFLHSLFDSFTGKKLFMYPATRKPWQEILLALLREITW